MHVCTHLCLCACACVKHGGTHENICILHCVSVCRCVQVIVCEQVCMSVCYTSLGKSTPRLVPMSLHSFPHWPWWPLTSGVSPHDLFRAPGTSSGCHPTKTHDIFTRSRSPRISNYRERALDSDKPSSGSSPALAQPSHGNLQPSLNLSEPQLLICDVGMIPLPTTCG